MSEWETVVGLEVHVELATETKLFSHAPNRFGDAPNTNITPVCLGLPGSLPVLNRRAVELAMTIGLALGCEIRPSVFHRKNYFYPDMPKDYQVSQYDRPICVNGSLDLPNGTRIRIERAHLEEDAGKTTHLGGEDGRIHGADQALVDYNRAGVPLLEIVSQPDIRSAEDARAYVEELRAILIATQASEARLEEGSMRVDANVSVRPSGSEELRTRCEIKNLNSLRSLQRAVSYEAQRHIDLYEAGENPTQETRHWSEDGRTHTLRSKEEANDYRYFPEPDLVLLEPDPAWIQQVTDSMPELPAQQREKLIDLAGLDMEDAATIVTRGMSQLVTAAVEAGADPRRAVTHVIQNLVIDGAEQLDPTHFVELIRLEHAGDLTATQTKQVLSEMVATGLAPSEIAQNLGFESMEAGELETLVDAAIAENSEAWEKFCQGEEKVQGVFVGAVMKASKGQADGKAVTAILNQRRG
ncbi:MAG: Asp-tRNA(Asn)/Glu-tRNA(Gln) amidotransferase GatCAB subunit B [Acidimicrobiaceae bacterium]|jgi:aspartyl-tRNA(Asn)/glutamyl-tRNA(Gln) amidotransferase subunit B|nr:Asp-tRNA(Asn)/Glu-tRNA(Gln) amidotransferase GatCAB subunit B [Acidimicrobiaceae bacterium]MCH2626663.1 Asp-tRNA(Asn)/Glu-tRNA(Gln) amidotransferase subunit GatB [Acidimicrobiales bacterium]MEC9114722.1 Asp-tRNA(Asn)/Glu-tRNA(Gln) amidotransferase subunit GatB [Actinomycetota bacterium]|tara:strand:- start:2647 stop:4053 length:1407 start_codon:yes stop_codon:yes gene_type:complete